MAVVGFVQLIPVSVSGLGTRDAALIFLFSQIGVGKEAAVAFSIMKLFVMFVFSGALALAAIKYLGRVEGTEAIKNELVF